MIMQWEMLMIHLDTRQEMQNMHTTASIDTVQVDIIKGWYKMQMAKNGTKELQ